ncbi:BamA/TamA family outer membrane protein [Flavobacterium jejuense]|uniref:BamA/TamA family outer membrane protein n=1 Tax=Flavobacterium jejuense TaxID=1544455 RepID=A0ABX0IUM3_9FLAO|nr:BamA/TamA family outer membrane protein [Flavobacterium jejuense]NHN26896.1 BamA/TamA family outer membrane protein [Flavobacterium jejuense]
MKKHLLLYLVTITLLLFSCSGTKNIPEGDLLYIGHQLEVNGEKVTKSERKNIENNLDGLIRPKPNRSILGMRPDIFFYNLAGDVKKEKGFRHWIKYKLGRKPVLFSEVDLSYNNKIIQNYTENKGFFNVQTISDSTKRGKKGIAKYKVTLNHQYKIKQIVYPEDSTTIAKQITNLKKDSFLKVGEAYDLEKIKNERNRIDTKLKELGYYYFNENFLITKVDSTVGNHEVDVILAIKKDTPEKAKQAFNINSVYVYSNFKIDNDTLNINPNATTKYENFTIIDDEKLFKPVVFENTLYFKKGDLYNRTNHNLSLNRIITLGTFKFVKNQFKESDTIGNYLDAYYYLTPLPKKSIRLEALAKSNSANYSGTELNINWSNRNTFKGAELLALSVFGGLEVQVSGQNNGFNVYRFGGESSLTWPRFILPFKTHTASGYVPRTKAILSYEYQFRSKLYSLQTFKSSFGYLWKENKRKEHNLNVFDITYTSSNGITDLYKQQIAENTSLEKVIQKQLIFGPTYSYTYTNSMLTNKKNTFYFKGALDLSANATRLILGANDVNNPKTILGVPFSQFSKFEIDFRHYLNFNKDTKLASRIIMGVGIPYGNSNELPFIKQFFIGGTSSIRAFRARSIGPGTFIDTTNNTFLPDQSGDLKFEFNTELRTKIYDLVKGAVFVDGGNIWLLNEDINKPGATFSKNFMNQLAIGAGVGLRFDFSFLVLRTDFAFPLRKPYLPKGEEWVIDDINFGNGNWRKENLIFNLAIGYPF